MPKIFLGGGGEETAPKCMDGPLCIWAFNSFEAQTFGPRAYQVWTTLLYSDGAGGSVQLDVPVRAGPGPRGVGRWSEAFERVTADENEMLT